MRRTHIIRRSRLRRLPSDDLNHLGLQHKDFVRLSRAYKALNDYTPRPVQNVPPIFRHEPLQPNEIRLVDFSAPPGEPAVISVSLEKDVPRYRALSYCWGSDNCLHQFVLNGQTLILPSNLYIAFRDLQRYNYRGKLWADAICINQQDSSEKATQIPLMGKIYSGATTVIGWLGEPRAMYDHFMRDFWYIFNRLANEFDLDPERIPMNVFLDDIEERLGLPKPHHKVWACLAELVGLAWFRRVWILQESLLAKNIILCWGPLRCSLEDLADLSSTLYTLGVDAYCVQRPFRFCLASNTSTLEGVAALCQARRHFSSNPLPVASAMVYSLARETTRLQDKVYALYNVSSLRGQIPVDLAASPEVVFTRAAEIAIGIEHDFALLSITSASSLPGLPSWVLDLSNESLPARRLTDCNFSAGLGVIPATNPSVVHKDFNDILCIEGIALDRVRDVNPLAPADEIAMTPLAARNILDFLGCCVLQTFKAAPLLTSVEVYRVVSRTLLCDRPVRDRHLRFGDADARNCEIIVSFLQKAARNIPAGMREAAYLPEAFYNAVRARVFYTTHGGRVGLGPKHLQSGDTVLLLFGGGTPYIARKRPTGKTYEFIGETYVDGIMYGEAKRAHEASENPNELFEFD